MSCHSLLTCKVSVERSVVSLMEILLYVVCCFSLSAFKIYSLHLIFVSLTNVCLGIFLLGFVLYGTLWTVWIWAAISFPILGNSSTVIFSSIFTWPFLLSSSSRIPMIRMLLHLMLSHRSLSLSSLLFTLFFSFLYSVLVISTILSSSSLPPQLLYGWLLPVYL